MEDNNNDMAYPQETEIENVQHVAEIENVHQEAEIENVHNVAEIENVQKKTKSTFKIPRPNSKTKSLKNKHF